MIPLNSLADVPSDNDAPNPDGRPELLLLVGPFPIGRLVCTPGVLQRIHPDDIATALQRHCRCDWGELGQEDRAENDRALREGGRLFSAYTCRNGARFWVITECDRSATTALLPEEY